MMDKLDVATFSRNSFTYNAIVRAMIAVIISTFRPPQKLQLVATNQNIFANKENCAEFTVDVDIICSCLQCVQVHVERAAADLARHHQVLLEDWSREEWSCQVRLGLAASRSTLNRVLQL